MAAWEVHINIAGLTINTGRVKSIHSQLAYNVLRRRSWFRKVYLRVRGGILAILYTSSQSPFISYPRKSQSASGHKFEDEDNGYILKPKLTSIWRVQIKYKYKANQIGTGSSGPLPWSKYHYYYWFTVNERYDSNVHITTLWYTEMLLEYTIMWVSMKLLG